MIKQRFYCDDEIKELMLVDPDLLIVLANMVKWANDRGVRLCVTSILRDYDKFSKSDTHQTGRAFDLSVKGWSNDDIEEFTLYFTQNFGKLGAIVDGSPRLIVHHNIGLGDHLHIQVRRK